VPLFILEDDPQRSGAYEQRLNHRDPVDVPVESRALVEALVYIRADESRNGGRKDMEDEMVAQEAEEDLVDVVRKRRQAQLVGERLARLHEQRGRRKRVPHIGSE